MRKEPWSRCEAETISDLVGDFGHSWWLLQSAMRARLDQARLSEADLEMLTKQQLGIGGTSSDLSVHHARSARQIEQYFGRMNKNNVLSSKRTRERAESSVPEEFYGGQSDGNTAMLQSVKYLIEKLGVVPRHAGGDSHDQSTTMRIIIPAGASTEHEEDMILDDDDLPLFPDTPTGGLDIGAGLVHTEVRKHDSSVHVAKARTDVLAGHAMALLHSSEQTMGSMPSAIAKVMTSAANGAARKRARLSNAATPFPAGSNVGSLSLRRPSSSGLLGGAVEGDGAAEDISSSVYGSHPSHDATIRESYATSLLGPLRILLKNSSSNNASINTGGSEGLGLDLRSPHANNSISSSNYLQSYSQMIASGCNVTGAAPTHNLGSSSSGAPSPSAYMQAQQQINHGSVSIRSPNASSSGDTFSPHLSSSHPLMQSGAQSPSVMDAPGNHSLNLAGNGTSMIGGLPGLKSLLTLSQQQSGATSNSWVPSGSGAPGSLPSVPSSLSNHSGMIPLPRSNTDY